MLRRMLLIEREYYFIICARKYCIYVCMNIRIKSGKYRSCLKYNYNRVVNVMKQKIGFIAPIKSTIYTEYIKSNSNVYVLRNIILYILTYIYNMFIYNIIYG